MRGCVSAAAGWNGGGTHTHAAEPIVPGAASSRSAKPPRATYWRSRRGLFPIVAVKAAIDRDANQPA